MHFPWPGDRINVMKLVDRIRLSIRRRAGQVILRAEVSGLGSPSQVSHALKCLQDKGELVRLGAGVYAKATREAGTGAVRPLADFETLAREAADKLHMMGPKPVGPVGAVQAPQDSGHPLVFDTGSRRVSRKLALEGRSVVYVNDWIRSRGRSSGQRSGAHLAIPTVGVAQFVRDLAREYHVNYTRTSLDQWAEIVTQLAGDEVRSGPVQDLLVALKRAGKLSSDDMAALLVNYLREQKQGVRSV